MATASASHTRDELVAELQADIKQLARERHAVILAHNYERPEVQDVADFVGDSLGLSREAAKTSADVIVFCGVHFMAETAAILSPEKTVLLPDLAAGCSLASTIDPENIRLQRQLHPEAEFLIHPECGCSTSVLEAMSAGDIDPEGVQILSTEGMIKRPALSSADEFIVATEVGILHRLRRENPSKRFHAANERASCAYMKVTTLPQVRNALVHIQYRITVPADVAKRARLAIERMVAIGGNAKQPLSPIPDGVDPGE